MAFPDLVYPVLSSERIIYIDGVLIGEVAALSGNTEELEYEDVCLYFDKTPDEFTRNMFKDMLAALYRGRMDRISLWDDIEVRHFGGGLSPEFACELGTRFNTPTDVVGFDLYMNGIASRNYESANAPNKNLILEYLFEDPTNIFKQEAIVSENAIDRIVAILKMDRALIDDIDRERAKEVLGYFDSKGCEKFDDLKDLIDIFIKTPTRTDI